MIQSMTGYADKRFDSQYLSAKISIKTLNHRFFDWSYRGTPIGSVENRLRAVCQKKLHRGRVEVSVELVFLDSSRWDFWFNEDLLEKIFSSLERIFSKMQKKISFSVDNIFAIPRAVEMRRKDFTKDEVSFLEKKFDLTLEYVIKARIREGKEMGREIRGHVQNIRQVLRRVEKLAKTHPLIIREKLELRLKDQNYETSFSEEKIVEEAAFLAQRYDLTEEITRLKYHLNYMEELLSSKKEEPVGKKLDFIAQELYREANTINSKAQDIEIIKEILTTKSEVETIRQQVQNIE